MAAHSATDVDDSESGGFEMQDTPNSSQDGPKDSLPVVETPRPGNNLPPQLTSFVGREGEIATVETLLSGHRLLTLTGVGIIGNSIFSNGGLGIDLSPDFEGDGPTANDPGDSDTGPNNLQNKPVISSAKKITSSKTTIEGKLNSKPNRTFEVQLYSNPKGTDEGKKFLFSRTVSTDGSGNATFSFATTKRVALGQAITATVTGSDGTSEFSTAKGVVAG